tara:strand:- start:711 stop:893 length:183 start_codon:yes stop_codon:yes gene_type:complete
MDYLNDAQDWIMDRIKERTSIDGLGLIVVCGSVILFGGLAKLLAWVGLAWGIYTLVKKES